MIKESIKHTEEHSELFLLHPTINKSKRRGKQPIVPIVDINKKTLDKLHGWSFNPSHLESEEVSKQNLAGSTMIKMARLMVKTIKNIC